MVKKQNKGRVEPKSRDSDALEEETANKSEKSYVQSYEKPNNVDGIKSSQISDFQSILKKTKSSILSANSDFENDFDPNGSASSEMFFELANAKAIQDGDVVISQDINEDLDHSGGIIWETSYLLYQYLVHNIHVWKKAKSEKTQILEIGAGCGYLGCSLGKKFIELQVCHSNL